MDLQDLDGVGSVMEQRLKDAGVETIDDLAEASVDQLTDSGISESRAEEFIFEAKKNAVVIQSGEEVVKEIESKGYRTTGMGAFDEMLGGGLREGHIVGLSGESGGGKTQLIFQCLVQAVEQTGDPAVYIETERERYEPDRIKALTNEEDTQDLIYKVPAYDLDQQLMAYGAVQENFESVSLVAVDSFTSRFRLSPDFEGRATLADRNSVIAQHLNGIEDMATRMNCPVILALQVMGNPSRWGRDTVSWGGTLLDHTVTYRIRMSSGQGSFRKAELRGHPGQKDQELQVSIGSTGLTAHRDN